MLEHASLNLWSWHKWHKSGNISWLLPLYITENKKRKLLLKLEWLRTKGKFGRTIFKLDNCNLSIRKFEKLCFNFSLFLINYWKQSKDIQTAPRNKYWRYWNKYYLKLHSLIKQISTPFVDSKICVWTVIQMNNVQNY